MTPLDSITSQHFAHRNYPQCGDLRTHEVFEKYGHTFAFKAMLVAQACKMLTRVVRRLLKESCNGK